MVIQPGNDAFGEIPFTRLWIVPRLAPDAFADLLTGDNDRGTEATEDVFLLFVDQGSDVGGIIPRIELISVIANRLWESGWTSLEAELT